jgi:hypothetical protein
MIITTKTIKGYLLGVGLIWFGIFALFITLDSPFKIALGISASIALIMIGYMLMKLTVLVDTD